MTGSPLQQDESPEPPTPAKSIGADDDLLHMLRQIARGDQQSFANVFQRTSPKLLGICLRILPTRQEAEDALQEAYLSIWRRAASFDESRGRPWPWLAAVTRNCAIDRLRASRPIAETMIGAAADVADPLPLASDMLLSREREQRLADCLEELDLRDTRLIRSAFLEGSTYPELAARTASPLGTVKSRIRRALLKLRDCL